MIPKIMLLVCLFVVALLSTGCDQSVSFTQDVFPILEKNCLNCHQVNHSEYSISEFSVATYPDIMKGTKFGPVIEPGMGFASTLMILIKHKADPSINMPFGEKSLSENEIGIIKRWIDQGAKNN